MITIIILTSIAGIIGTSLGGVIGAIFSLKSNNSTSYILSFSGGIMLSIVFFDLIPESLKYGNYYITTLGIIWGIIILWIIDYFVTRKFYTNNKTVKIESLAKQNSKTSFYKIGIIMFLAIGLHNFPEGMAIGTISTIENNLAIALSIIIAIHNIPEGMAISTPLVKSGIKKSSAIVLSAIAGSITLVGGIVGLILGSINLSTTSFCLGLAGGAMLYVTFFDILPESFDSSTKKISPIIITIGLIFGFMLINII